MTIGIVALQYQEPYYNNTINCLRECGLPVYWADRQGIGNFSAAMNKAFENVTQDLCWFITDIEFDPATPFKLSNSLIDHNLAAIHPEHESDHLHHRPDGSGLVKEVPYIEFTAPMVRSDWYREVGGLDEDHWYWYQDLIFSKAVRDRGGKMAVDHGAPIRHIYRRNDIQYEVTKQRYKLRQERDIIEKGILVKKFGPDWKKVLWTQ